MKSLLLLALAPFALVLARPDRAPHEEASGASTVDAERARNHEAFRTGYLPHKEALIPEHAGDWLVIAGGRVMSARDGEPRPTDDLAEALKQADELAPDAKHRFVFRVGEEGEIYYRPTLSSRPNYIGTQLFSYFDGNFWITPDGMYVVPRGKSWDEGRRIGSGTEAEKGPSLVAELSAPGGKKTQPVEFQVATGFSGYAVIAKAQADALGLHRFEIPGGIVFHEGMSPLRRGRAHFEQTEGGLDADIPVAIRQK